MRYNVYKKNTRTYKRRKKILSLMMIFLLALVSTILVSNNTFARYKKNIDINITSTTGEMICDIQVDTNDGSGYTDDDGFYFNVTVSNTIDNVVTDTGIDYKITISNSEGTNSNGIFFIESDTTGEYGSIVTSQVYTFDTNSSSKVFKVYVKVPSNEEEMVNLNINLDAVQKEIEE